MPYSHSIKSIKSPRDTFLTPTQKTLLAAAISTCLFSHGVTHAATFVVINLNQSGAGSLSQAIVDSNNAAGADEITFGALSGDIRLTDAQQLAITDDLTITGPGANNLSITQDSGVSSPDLIDITSEPVSISISGLTLNRASGNSRLITVNEFATLTIANCTLSNESPTPTSNFGGAIFSDFESTLSISNSEISGHSSSGSGGAIFNYYSTTSITESTISGNSSNSRGGAIRNQYSTLTIENSTISGNTSDSGGAIHNTYSETTISDSTLSNNNATGNGGAIYSYSSNLTLTKSVLTGNTSSKGGAIHLYTYDSNSLTNISSSLLTGNTASSSGGAIRLYDYYGSTTLNLNNSVISGNSANNSGGAISTYGYESRSNLNINNTIVSGNTADRTGGINLYAATTELLNSTITNNTTSSRDGGGIRIEYQSSINAVNTVIAGNTRNGIPNDILGDITLDYSFIGVWDGMGENTYTEPTAGSNQIGSTSSPFDPSLSALQDNGGISIGANGEYTLLSILPASTSPLIGAGDNNATNSSLTLATTDIRGTGFNRIVDSTIEIGATEYYIDPNAENSSDDSGGGSSSLAELLFLTSLLSFFGFRRKK